MAGRAQRSAAYWRRRILALLVSVAAGVGLVCGVLAARSEEPTLPVVRDTDRGPARIAMLGYSSDARAVIASDGTAGWRREWRRCRSGDCHVRLGSADPITVSMRPGDRIELWATSDDELHMASTPPWLGPVRVVRRPRLRGNAVVGATLRAIPGRFSGGFQGDDGAGGLVGLRVCPTRAGTGCFLMGDWRERSGRTATLTAAHAGWFVGAIQRRIGPTHEETAEAWAIPRSPREGRPAPPAGPLVATGPLVGPVS